MPARAQKLSPTPPRRVGPGRPRKLTHERIVEAALAVMEKEGFAALTIRSLATELGTTHSTLYNYVDRVEDIETEALRSLTAEIPLPRATTAPALRAELLAHLMAARRLFLKHPRVLYPTIGSPSWELLSDISEQWYHALVPFAPAPHVAVLAHGALVSAVATSAERERAYNVAMVRPRKSVLRLLGDVKLTTFEDVLGALIDQLLPGLAVRPSARKS